MSDIHYRWRHRWRTVYKLSSHWGGVRITSAEMNRDFWKLIQFDWTLIHWVLMDMWTSDPEYSDSELRSSRSQWWLAMNCVRLHRLTQLKYSPMQAVGLCTCDQWPSDARDNKCCWDYKLFLTPPDLMPCRIPRCSHMLYIQLGTSF